MHRLLLTPRCITLLQEDGAELVRWGWVERDEAIATLRACWFYDAADFLETVKLFAPVAEQFRLPEAA